jgi:hypothetical protein
VIGLPAFDIGLTIYEIPPGYPAEDNGRENDVPGLGALLMAFSSIIKLYFIKVLTHQNICNTFLIYFQIIYPAFLGQRSAFQKPCCLNHYIYKYKAYLIIWILVKHLTAYFNAFIKFLSIVSADCKDERIHFDF